MFLVTMSGVYDNHVLEDGGFVTENLAKFNTSNRLETLWFQFKLK